MMLTEVEKLIPPKLGRPKLPRPEPPPDLVLVRPKARVYFGDLMQRLLGHCVDRIDREAPDTKRSKRAFNWRRLARWSGIPYSMLWRWRLYPDRHSQSITYDRMDKVAQLLGIDVLSMLEPQELASAFVKMNKAQRELFLAAVEDICIREYNLNRDHIANAIEYFEGLPQFQAVPEPEIALERPIGPGEEAKGMLRLGICPACLRGEHEEHREEYISHGSAGTCRCGSCVENS